MILRLVIPEKTDEEKQKAFHEAFCDLYYNGPQSPTSAFASGRHTMGVYDASGLPDSILSIGPESLKLKSDLVVVDDYKYLCITSLNNLTIESIRTHLGSGAFQLCTNLKTVSIDSTQVDSISDSCFQNCISLNKIEIKAQLLGIGKNSFASCKSLKLIIIPKPVRIIGEGAFSNCENLEEIILPSGLKKIENSAFKGCASLKSIKLPSSLTHIGEGAFSNCENLEEIILPSTLKKIEDSAFKGCTSLKSIMLPSSLTHIGEEAFSGCKSLVNVGMGNNTSEIGKRCFENCQNLKELVFGKKLSRFRNLTNGCSSLQRIHLPAGIMEISLGDCKVPTIVFEGSSEEWMNACGLNWWNSENQKITICCKDRDLVFVKGTSFSPIRLQTHDIKNNPTYYIEEYVEKALTGKRAYLNAEEMLFVLFELSEKVYGHTGSFKVYREDRWNYSLIYEYQKKYDPTIRYRRIIGKHLAKTTNNEEVDKLLKLINPDDYLAIINHSFKRDILLSSKDMDFQDIIVLQSEHPLSIKYDGGKEVYRILEVTAPQKCRLVFANYHKNEVYCVTTEITLKDWARGVLTVYKDETFTVDGLSMDFTVNKILGKMDYFRIENEFKDREA